MEMSTTTTSQDDPRKFPATQWTVVLAADTKRGGRSNLPERPGGCCAQIGPVPFSPEQQTAQKIERQAVSDLNLWRKA